MACINYVNFNFLTDQTQMLLYAPPLNLSKHILHKKLLSQKELSGLRAGLLI